MNDYRQLRMNRSKKNYDDRFTVYNNDRRQQSQGYYPSLIHYESQNYENRQQTAASFRFLAPPKNQLIPDILPPSCTSSSSNCLKKSISSSTFDTSIISDSPFSIYDGDDYTMQNLNIQNLELYISIYRFIPYEKFITIPPLKISLGKNV
ncbi:hypothetical protein DERP_002355 [Dermatophagoides pteronyssinus]|uniref:Uncharacterized protein n=1 Tax=Dermatophagoides pteronyssinus TaxID=6956 RepID=A0ABQ8JHI3_DERPT|nr:hypothetical protein DERP_002355 [Dermatophagoides pteronyssinus]